MSECRMIFDTDGALRAATQQDAVLPFGRFRLEDIRPLSRAEQRLWSRWHAGLPGWAVLGFKERYGSLFGVIPGGRRD